MSKQDWKKIKPTNTVVEFCHNLLLPSEGYAALVQRAEHKLTNIFRLAAVRSGHRREVAGRHNYDRADPTGDNDP